MKAHTQDWREALSLCLSLSMEERGLQQVTSLRHQVLMNVSRYRLRCFSQSYEPFYVSIRFKMELHASILTPSYPGLLTLYLGRAKALSCSYLTRYICGGGEIVKAAARFTGEYVGHCEEFYLRRRLCFSMEKWPFVFLLACMQGRCWLLHTEVPESSSMGRYSSLSATWMIFFICIVIIIIIAAVQTWKSLMWILRLHALPCTIYMYIEREKVSCQSFPSILSPPLSISKNLSLPASFDHMTLSSKSILSTKDRSGIARKLEDPLTRKKIYVCSQITACRVPRTAADLLDELFKVWNRFRLFLTALHHVRFSETPRSYTWKRRRLSLEK